jgi:hypothetical protein
MARSGGPDMPVRIMPASNEIVPPAAIVCSVCGNKMGLVAVEQYRADAAISSGLNLIGTSGITIP